MKIIKETIKLGNTDFYFSGLNRFGKRCYSPFGEDKSFFALEIKEDEMRENSPIEKYYKLDNSFYKVVYAMH